MNTPPRGVNIRYVVVQGLAAIPALPPNSPHFCIEKGFPIFLSTEDCSDPWDLFSLRNTHQRKLVAAVARCAWLDELARLAERGQPYDGTLNAARDNAEAWREWGLK